MNNTNFLVLHIKCNLELVTVLLSYIGSNMFREYIIGKECVLNYFMLLYMKAVVTLAIAMCATIKHLSGFVFL